MKSKLLLFINLLLIVKINAQQQISNFSYENINEFYTQGFIEFNNHIFFNGATDGSGQEIWKSDGTNSNTTLLKDINHGNEDGITIFPLTSSSAILNNELYFIATDGSSSGEIWKTDGTNSGTLQVTDFLNGKVTQLTAAGSFIFFLIKTDNTLQVWKTDGSNAGTVLVKDELPIQNIPSFQGKCNDTFIFTFEPYQSSNSRVWRSDGTSNGTFPITDEIDGNGSGSGGYGSGARGTTYLSQYIEYNDKLYFVSRNYLYETDGTLENTNIITNLWNASTNIVEFSDVIEANNKLYFQFFSADNFQLSIWESDGTLNNTKEVYTNNSSQYFFPSYLAKTNNSLLFCSSNQSGGTALNSMNFSDYVTTNLIELSNSPMVPFTFQTWNACQIYKIVNDEFFISSFQENSFARRGWISNIATNTTNHISSLDNVSSVISYNQTLYYSKDFQLWKYTNILNTESIEPESSLLIYPNPSSDFIKFNINYGVESVCIFDLSGRLVINISEYNNSEIDISELNQGTYLVKIRLNGASIIKRIIIK